MWWKPNFGNADEKWQQEKPRKTRLHSAQRCSSQRCTWHKKLTKREKGYFCRTCSKKKSNFLVRQHWNPFVQKFCIEVPRKKAQGFKRTATKTVVANASTAQQKKRCNKMLSIMNKWCALQWEVHDFYVNENGNFSFFGGVRMKRMWSNSLHRRGQRKIPSASYCSVEIKGIVSGNTIIIWTF